MGIVRTKTDNAVGQFDFVRKFFFICTSSNMTHKSEKIFANLLFIPCICSVFFVVMASATLMARSPQGPSSTQNGWISLFDGETTDGWIQHGGDAKFDARDGVLVGTAVADSPNSYLCTKQMYEDFVLEFDVKMDEGFNSGLQIRTRPEKGHVYGPQVDILPEGRPAGYIYGVYEKDTDRRGWLSPDRSFTDAHRSGKWNHYRIKAVGSRIQTWVNNQKVADLSDTEIAPTGVIGIQVHSVSEKHAGRQVRIKNLRLKPLNNNDWKSLFNGRSLDGWKNPYDHGKPLVKNGEIRLHSEGGKYFLASENAFDDFIFEASVKVPDRDGNSGIHFRSKIKSGRVFGYQAEVDPSDRSWSGGLYEKGERGWVENLKNQPHAQSAFKPDEWNRYRIHAEGDRIRIYVNGVKTVDVRDDGARSGHFALQHHGENGKTYRFRNLRILELN